jgi:hypothetical protein
MSEEMTHYHENCFCPSCVEYRRTHGEPDAEPFVNQETTDEPPVEESVPE